MLYVADLAGTIPGWITAVLLGGLFLYTSRHGGSEALETLSKSNDILAAKAEEQGSRIRDLEKANAELKAKTDVTIAIAPLLAWSESHESRAADRHVAILQVLDLIAARLGPDPNGHGE